MDILEKVKRLTIIALLADELLMALLVLKGGNAIDIAYDLSSRGSIDIDFSMDRDFTAAELNRVRNQAAGLLNAEFNKENLHVFDVNLWERPQIIKDEVKTFWGGYNLQFKLIEDKKYQQFKDDLASLQRNALPVGGKGSTKFEVDISKYEYTSGKRRKDLDGLIIYVYSPEMLAIEKLRALCQQNPDYRNVVLSMTPKSRGRDFYDIHNLISSFSLELTDGENLILCKNIFEAKRVPLDYLSRLAEQYELHKQSWDSVRDTINQKENLRDFDFYFNFVVELAQRMFKVL
jgi:hypothetical protein